MSRLKLFLFGPPRIERDQDRVEVSLRKAVALLAYLAVTRQPHSRDSLATLFWPEADQSTALGNLRRALYRLNQALHGDVLVTTRTMVEVNGQSQLWLDTHQFWQAVSFCLTEPGAGEPLPEACPQRLQQAVELYTADFMAGFTLPDSPDFDEWQFFEMESHRRALGQALEQLTAYFSHGGEWEQAIVHARRHATLDPLQEHVHRCLMELYAWTDQHTAALRQYETLQRLLAEELGVEPEEETTQLYRSIKRRRVVAPDLVGFRGLPGGVSPANTLEQTLAPQSAPHRQEQREAVRRRDGLPSPAQPLVGRDEELASIVRLLTQDPACRVLSIVGTGGIGKTRLALEAARRAGPAFAHGVYFVAVADLGSVDHLVPAVAEAVGLGFFEGSTARAQLLRFLRDKEMLLVLDSFEHLLPDIGLVADLVQAAPGLKLLVTSRERLNISAEQFYVLGSMSFPQGKPAQDVLTYGAVQLLVQRAWMSHPRVEVKPEDVEHVLRICRLVEGMPLALVLAASWLEVLTFREIADEIALSLDFLEGSLQDVPERQRSVRAAFDYSWQQLSDEDREAFARLSVFRGGFTRQAAQRVAGADPRALRRLSVKSLLSWSEQRYAIHELLRQYGAEKMQASGEANQIQDLHAEYYLNLVCQRELDLKGRRPFEAMAEIDTELENLRLAWRRSLAMDKQAIVGRAAESLYLFFTMSSRFQEGSEFFDEAQQRWAPCLDVEMGSTCGRIVARSAWLRSLYFAETQDLQPEIEMSLAVARRHENQAEIAFCLMLQGAYTLHAHHDPAAALPLLQDSLAHYQALEDRFYQAGALFWLGVCYSRMSRLPQMVRVMSQSLELAQQTGNAAIVPLARSALAWASLASGDYAVAERHSQAAVAANTRLGLGVGVAEAKVQLALLRFLAGDVEQATMLAEQGLVMAEQVGFVPGTADALAVVGLVAVVGGDPAAGLARAEQSLGLPASSFGQIVGHWAAALAHGALAETDLAVQHLRQALAQARERGYSAMPGWLLSAALLPEIRQGRGERAVTLLSAIVSRRTEDTGWLERWDALTAARAHLLAELEEERYARAWEKGQDLDLALVVSGFLDNRSPSRVSLDWC